MLRRRLTAMVLAVLMLIGMPLEARAYTYNETLYGGRSMDYFHRVQNEDGGFPATPGRASGMDTTAWVVMALEAAGEDADGTEWAKGGKTPVDYLLEADYAMLETNAYSKVLLALSAAGRGTVRKGVDLLAALKGFQQADGAFYQPSQGETGMVNSHIWAVLAIASTGAAIPNKAKAREWLIQARNSDGGYGWHLDVASDADDTAAAIQALLVLGELPGSPVILKAKAFLKACQNSDGGFFSSSLIGPRSNTASDAWAMQAILALGEDYRGDAWKENGAYVRTHLLSMMQEDGSYAWQSGTVSMPVKMTAYAVTALSDRSYPVNRDYEAIRWSHAAFPDVASSHWAAPAIRGLASGGVLTGYPDGSFKPENPVTRAEFTTMLIKAFGLAWRSPATAKSFTDVPRFHWARQFVLLAYEEGFIQGRSASIFDPAGSISGAEVATIAVNTLPAGEKTGLDDGPYWYSGEVALAEAKGLLYPGFSATKPASRAACAYVLDKLRESR